MGGCYPSLDPARLAMLDPRSTDALTSWLAVAAACGLEEAHKLFKAWHSSVVEDEEEVHRSEHDEDEMLGDEDDEDDAATAAATRYQPVVVAAAERPAVPTATNAASFCRCSSCSGS